MSEKRPTPEQQRVIDVRDGITEVQACPGSGKTQTLIWRCQALDPLDKKIVLAFNTAAKDEFKARVNNPTTAPYTFHGFCNGQVLKSFPSFGYTKRPRFPTDKGLYGLLAQLNACFGTDYKKWEQTPWDEELLKEQEDNSYTNAIVVRLSYLKSLIEEAEEAGTTEPTEGPKREWLLEAETLEAVLAYREWLIESNIITFNAQVRLVAENLDVIEIDAQHIMVDEYQDVDQMQFDIVVHLATYPGVESTMVVGDRNQSIYGWRGALKDPFGQLADAFPCNHDVKTILEHNLINPLLRSGTHVSSMNLTCNFRSYDPILEFAECIVQVGMTGVRGGSDPVTMLEPGEARAWILDGYLPMSTPTLADRIILCRYNVDTVRWQLDLARSGVPVNLNGRGDFWKIPHIRLARQAWKDKQDETALRASGGWKRFETTKRYVGDEDFRKQCIDDVKWVLSLKSSEMELLQRCLQDVTRGLKISTIHKVKGKEYKRVLVHGADKKLRNETEVYYVACTRAEDALGIDYVQEVIYQ